MCMNRVQKLKKVFLDVKVMLKLHGTNYDFIKIYHFLTSKFLCVILLYQNSIIFCHSE